MIQWIRQYIRKRRVARGYKYRSGVTIFQKRREVHEAYLIANRQNQKEVEEFHRGQLNMIDWMVSDADKK